jgi:hypothetical protein
MTVPNLTSQHIDFNEWLKECPVEWFRSIRPTGKSSVTYEFFFNHVNDELLKSV